MLGGGMAKGTGRGVKSPAGRWVEDAQLWARASSAEPQTPGMWGRGKAGPEGQSPPSGPEFDIM